ncbi:glyocosyltransferase [Brachyspira pilosicoli]|uniref:glyocosyltransferase n=1 Tax=Brachyspira pilosicoli TaxID=52584 RepID=UPI001CA50051|nr:glyocosyltransferase [Brachyspira pilosicoli]MBW5396974.1 glyocosyltransferase [Brachyspira pilosicoli]
MKKAVLFMIFNRPDPTSKVFEAIREAKPPRLYVAADGPRKNVKGEYKKCISTREIIKEVDWDCEVKTLFRDENLGCGLAVSGAINWFFENEEDGIILEDDCLPNQSFFYFCEELLDYYKDNEKIMHIHSNHIGKPYSKYSYYFSSMERCWGWATWRRAWKLYDYNLEKYSYDLISKKIEEVYFSDLYIDYWKDVLKIMTNDDITKRINTWDYQWSFSILANDGLCICPNVNLVSNIGWGNDSTHCHNEKDKLSNMASYEIKEIIHPNKIERNLFIDEDSMSKKFHYVLPNTEYRLNMIISNIRSIVNKLAWYIPIRKLRDKFRDDLYRKIGI